MLEPRPLVEQSDRLLKFKVINDVLLLVTPLDWLPLTQVGSDAPLTLARDAAPFSTTYALPLGPSRRTQGRPPTSCLLTAAHRECDLGGRGPHFVEVTA